MYRKFKSYIENEILFEKSHKLLIGVSGGADSVVLASLVNRLENPFALAHCNFNLRGADSDADEAFVRDMARQLGVKCFVTSFPTKEYAAEKGISIEMAARELRYAWFEQIRAQKGFDYILVGHHLDDVLETFMLNLSRGTGIRGLSGISNKAGRIVRPLLFARRIEVEKYAFENELDYRFDKSNDDTGIKRNKVRHELIPLFEKLNPSFRKSLQKTIDNLNETETVYVQKVDEIRNKVVSSDNNWVKIDVEELRKHQPVKTYLYEILSVYGFNPDVAAEIHEAIDAQPGLKFYSPNYRLVSGRNELIITAIEANTNKVFYISEEQQKISEPLSMNFHIEAYTADYAIPRQAHTAVLDFDELSFPIILRKWNQGEYFRPLGMSGLKKISDFFIDEKLSIPEKENTWILYSGNKVVWIVGRRIDDRFKITTTTKTVFRIELNSND